MKGSHVLKFLLMASALGSISNMTHAMGQQPLQIDTVLLGSARLDRRSDEPGTVHIRKCLSDNLRLKHFVVISDVRPMRLERLELVDMDGKVSQVDVSADMPANSSLRIAGVPSHIRCLKEIRMVGSALEGRFGNLVLGARTEQAEKTKSN